MEEIQIQNTGNISHIDICSSFYKFNGGGGLSKKVVMKSKNTRKKLFQKSNINVF